MNQILFDSFLIVFALSIASGFLGPFIMWNKISYLGDAMAHSGLFALVISSAFCYLSDFFAIFVIAFCLSVTLIKVRHTRDTVLAVINSISIATAMFLLSAFPDVFNLEIDTVLFGDVLLVSHKEIIILYVICALILYLSVFNWRKWVVISMDRDFAKCMGINVRNAEIYIAFTLSVFVSFAVKIVGALLATSILILPSAAAKIFAKTPIHMILLSFLFCFLSSLCGIGISLAMDSSLGVSMIFAMSCVLILCLLQKAIARKAQ